MNKTHIIRILSVLAFGFPAAAKADFTLRTSSGNGSIGDINQAEFFLSNNSTTGGTAAVINFVGTGDDGSIPGGAAFPNGLSFSDDFALEATGYVTGLAGPSSFSLGVNSDDGFRLRVNNIIAFEYILPRGPGDSLASVDLKNGDFISLTFYERSGGEELEFFRILNGGTRQLVGDPASGIQISSTPPASAVPEPTTALMGLALCALPALQRRVRR